MKRLKELLPYIIIIVVVILIRTFIATPAIVNGSSMEDTLFDNELVLVNKIGLKLSGIKRFDIVVIDEANDMIIKRVIGLPNEEIEYIDNQLYIDGELVKFPIEFKDTEDFTSKLRSDEYYVLGDNRSISKDSRMIGPIKTNEIKGKVNFVLFPFSKFGIVE